jgi:hypothetical protein
MTRRYRKKNIARGKSHLPRYMFSSKYRNFGKSVRVMPCHIRQSESVTQNRESTMTGNKKIGNSKTLYELIFETGTKEKNLEVRKKGFPLESRYKGMCMFSTKKNETHTHAI